jgi:hypothetical protein
VLAGLFVDDSPVTTYLHSITIVALMGRHELDPAVAVTLVGQSANDTTHLQASSLLANGFPG